MVKAVLEAILIYWMHFWIPVGIIENIRKLCFKFLWSRNKDSASLPWNSWKNLACPKFLGGWGLKIPAIFAKSLVAKSVWNLIRDFGFRLQFRNMFIQCQFWIGSEYQTRRKRIYPYARKLFYGILILLVIILFGRLVMVWICVLVLTHGWDANGDIIYQLY